MPKKSFHIKAKSMNRNLNVCKSLQVDTIHSDYDKRKITPVLHLNIFGLNILVNCVTLDFKKYYCLFFRIFTEMLLNGHLLLTFDPVSLFGMEMRRPKIYTNYLFLTNTEKSM